MTQIAYILQKGRTGARAQGEVLAEAFADVDLVFGNPLGVEDPDQPYIRDGQGVVYPTADLADAVAALAPDIVFFHIFNEGVLQSLPAISTFATTVLRAGINPTEGLVSRQGGQGPGFTPVVTTIQSFDHVVAPAPGVARDLACLGVEAERVTVIPTALPVDAVQRPDPNQPAAVGCLSGRLSALKNQHTLVLAMGGLREVAPSYPAQLVLTGGAKPGYKEGLDHLAAAIGVAGRINFVGFVDPETGYFPQVGVNCLPSYSERMPQSVLEAARAGVPSIVADVAWAETFDSMVTVAPDDPLAWAEEVHGLLTNDARRMRVARAQQQELVARFAVEDAVDAYESLFDELLERTRPFKIDPGVLAA